MEKKNFSELTTNQQLKATFLKKGFKEFKLEYLSVIYTKHELQHLRMSAYIKELEYDVETKKELRYAIKSYLEMTAIYKTGIAMYLICNDNVKEWFNNNI